MRPVSLPAPAYEGRRRAVLLLVVSIHMVRQIGDGGRPWRLKVDYRDDLVLVASSFRGGHDGDSLSIVVPVVSMALRIPVQASDD
jgi:hypothetical protein